MAFTIALVGNPNCGKTTLFNLLTGAHQKVGNWPGVTVERKSGSLSLGSDKVEVVDLPGIYHLAQQHMGLDEKIARDAIHSGDFDLIINIVDASNIERNLILTQQLQEAGIPTVVALNMLDVAEQQGMTVNAETLAERLSLAVVPIIASRRVGVDLLKTLLRRKLTDAAEKPLTPKPETTPQAGNLDLPQRYHRARELLNGVVGVEFVKPSFTEKIDRWVLNKYLGIPCFLLMMYAMFTIAINLGAVFIDFFDIVFGAILVDGTRWALTAIAMPEIIVTFFADGLGGGIQLVATFIPVIGFLYLCLSVLEDSGYLSRAAFVIDRLMANIGLPGNAFVPLIVGFGCNVPSVMASRSLNRDSDRLLTIAMAPFMSCGARLTVYALFAAAFFQSNGQNIVFMLYLLGIALAVFTGWIFRRQIFPKEISRSVQEMPAYHVPVLRNIFITTWFRLKGFIFRAGKTIVAVVVVLSMLNSVGTDGSFGNEDSQQSVLSVIGKSITPVFTPLGVEEENWPATVGLFTGMFAKEAIVGTLDALYSEDDSASANGDGETNPAPDLIASFMEALGTIKTEFIGLADALTDPIGISIGDVTDSAAVAEDQGVQTGTLTNMASLFAGPFAAFTYLVFILLYAPCVAVLGAITKESGWRWMLIVFGWSTGLAYYMATVIYQVGTFVEHPMFSGLWIAIATAALLFAIQSLKRLGKSVASPQLIPVTQV
jgi:ferrous iron transport protein B